MRRLRLSGDFDFRVIASQTPGFVGADLHALTKEAAAIAIARIFSSLEECQAGLQPSNVPAEVQINCLACDVKQDK